MTTRQEHVAWAKKRALQYVEAGDLQGAFASLGSDLMKHPETARHQALHLGMMMLVAGMLSTQKEMRKFIEDVQ